MISNTGKAAVRFICEIFTFGALLNTAQFTEVDAAYYITAFVMCVQVFFFCIEKVDEDSGTKKILSVISFFLCAAVIFIYFAELWKKTWFTEPTWHKIVLILLVVSHLRMFLEDILQIVGSKNT